MSLIGLVLEGYATGCVSALVDSRGLMNMSVACFKAWGCTETPHFEPLQSTHLHSLSLKTTLLLALASVKQMGDLQALSVSPTCLEFGPSDSKVILKPRLGYVHKVLSTPFRAQVITFSVVPP